VQIRIAALVCAAAMAAGPAVRLGASGPKPPSMSENGRARLSGFLKAAVENGRVPGIVALVTGPDREVYVEAVGRSNLAADRPLRADAIFRIASMTKPITSVAAMMLYEAGKLSLDEPVATYLPDYQQPPVLVSYDAATRNLSTRPARRPVTIRHLLTHTSGIGYAFDDPVLAALQQAGRKDSEFPLLHDPGEKWTYGSNTQLLGRVLEKIAGEPLDEIFRRRVFEPLAMSDTFFRIPDEKHDRLVTRHQRQGDALVETPNAASEPATVRGDGGLMSDARGYGAFLRMLLNGGDSPRGRLLKARTVDLMTANQIAPLTVREMAAPMPSIALTFPTGAGRDTFGFGFQIAARGTSPRSAGSYSWAGVFNTFFWVDPERRIGVVLLMQVLPFFDDACKAVVEGFEERLYESL
jgi:methyl acetate hydrolase